MATTDIAVPLVMSEAEAAAHKRRWIALLILSISLMLIVIDSTIVNLAFPSIRETFKKTASYADVEWVNSIYSLVFGAALITWGKLGDQYGRRRIFIVGVAVFLVGSLGSGLAGSIGALIFFRAVQGMGGAMLSPSTLSIVSSTFKGQERGIAFGIWGATAGVSAALGPIIGGYLIQYGKAITPETWRLTFLINMPVGIIAILGSIWAIRESRDKSIKHRIDVLGIILASLAVGSIVFGAIEGQNYGWLQAKRVFTLGPITYPMLPANTTAIPAGTLSFIPFVFAFGALMLVLFVLAETRQERRGKEPLFEFGLLRHLSFRYGLLTVLIVALGEFGVVLVLSIYFQLAKGLGAFETGLRFLPFAIVLVIAAPMAGALSSRFGAKWVVTCGMIFEASSLFWISRVLYVDASFSSLLPPFLLYGTGVGLAIAQLANIVLSDIPADKAGLASGANNTIRQLGASLGIAIIGAVLFGTFASEAKPLIDQSTAFVDFGNHVADNPNIAANSKAVAALIAAFGDTAKQNIKAGLDANQGFDTNGDILDTALQQMPEPLKVSLHLDDPAVVQQIKTDLQPDVNTLAAQLQHTLGEGFSTAGRSAATVASIFVLGGALCSLLLPNVRRRQPGAVPVMAH